ncbi:Uncharacterized protein APZ42_013090 [Daphnia magna]|uniref:Reverse transcriptase RNase H-like domain-containing protein n=1 Tax=Daphnia magna TaxID=35525 RepID=A0A162R7Q1_9CRUS|nr:Uncharacterized protein APZ42_013090 [Daphnia magna]
MQKSCVNGLPDIEIKGFTAEVTSEVFALLRHSPRMTMTDGGRMVWEESSDPNAGGNGPKADEPHRRQGPDESNDERHVISTDCINPDPGKIDKIVNYKTPTSVDEHRQEHPIAYSSRPLTKAKMKYNTTEKEALAVIDAIKHFRYYLLDKPFETISDHRPLQWLKNQKDNNGRLERERTSHKRKFVTMAPSINQYSHQVQFVNSKADNRRLTSKSKAIEIASANISQGMADQITLSASDGSDSELESNHANSSVNSSSNKHNSSTNKNLFNHLIADLLPSGEVDKEAFKNFIGGLSGPLVIRSRPFMVELLKKEVDLGDADDNLCLEDHIHLPPHMRCTCHSLNLVATNGVKNIDSVRAESSSLASNFIKATMGELFAIHNATRWNSYYDALVKVENLLTKNRDNLAIAFDQFKLKKLTVLEQEFLREYIKIMKPLTEALDVFQNEEKIDLRLASTSDPRFKLSWLTKKQKPEYVKLLEKEVKRRASNLANESIEGENTATASLSETTSPPRKKPGSSTANNSSTYRAFLHPHEIAKAPFQSLGGSSCWEYANWENMLNEVLFAYRSSVHSSTLETPYYLVQGNLADRLRYSFQRVREESGKARNRQREQYNKRAKERKYVVGDRVLLDIRVVKEGDNRKFTFKYKGPYRVVKVYTNTTLDIEDNSYLCQRTHVNRLKPLLINMAQANAQPVDVPAGFSAHISVATVTAIAGTTTPYKGFIMPRMRDGWPFAEATATSEAINAVVSRIMVSETSYRSKMHHLAYGVGNQFLAPGITISGVNIFDIPDTETLANAVLRNKIRAITYSTVGIHDAALVTAVRAAWPTWYINAANGNPAVANAVGVAGEANVFNNPLVDDQVKAIVEQILAQDEDQRNVLWAFSYLAVFFAAMSKRGSVTQDWIIKYAAGIKADSGFLHDPYIDVAAIETAYRCYSPVFDAGQLFAYMETIISANCMRLRLTVERVRAMIEGLIDTYITDSQTAPADDPADFKIMCRQTIAKKIEDRFQASKQALAQILSKLTSICTTADVWKSRGRSYMGVTCHWLDTETLLRKSACLAK